MSAGLSSLSSVRKRSIVGCSSEMRQSRSGYSGSQSHSLSRCAISAPMRPRLSHTPARMRSISAGDFSGKAAANCARAILFSRNKGPIVRMKRAAPFASMSNGTRCSVRSRPTASAPVAASPARLAIRRRRRVMLLMGASEVDDDLAEHLPRLDAGKALLEVRQRELAVDDRGHARRHLRQTIADVLDAAAERAENLVLLLEQLHH